MFPAGLPSPRQYVHDYGHAMHHGSSSQHSADIDEALNIMEDTLRNPKAERQG
jgi:hypothetical protein